MKKKNVFLSWKDRIHRPGKFPPPCRVIYSFISRHLSYRPFSIILFLSMLNPARHAFSMPSSYPFKNILHYDDEPAPPPE
jgi:hypothetical protein